MINKILPYVAIGMISFSTIALVGCNDANTTKTEDILMSQCEKQSPQINCHAEYRKTYEASEKFNHFNPEDHPFEQQGLIFILEDKAFKRSHPEVSSISEIWFTLTGKQLYGAPEASQSADLKRVDDTYVLSPQLYDELITAVKTCNRATVESMQFKAGSVLTKEQYEKVMSIVLECKDYQLQKAINEK